MPAELDFEIAVLQKSLETRPEIEDGETLYRQCGTSMHHHHLTCRNCGRSVEV